MAGPARGSVHPDMNTDHMTADGALVIEGAGLRSLSAGFVLRGTRACAMFPSSR